MHDQKDFKGKSQKNSLGISYNEETGYFSLLLHFMILFLIILCVLINIFVGDGPKRFNVLPPQPYDKTPLACVDEIYSKWNLPSDFLQELWEFVQKSPKNVRTNRHQIMFTVTNQGQVNFTQNWFCSLSRTNQKPYSFVIICLDDESYSEMKAFNAPVILLRSNFTKKSVNNYQIVDFYDIVKIRPTILHQLLMWNCETVLSDADIVFFSDPWELFTGNEDFQAQSDSKVYYNYEPYAKKTPLFWNGNLGFYKVIPSVNVLKVMKDWLVRAYKTPKLVDQKALKEVLTNNPIACNYDQGIISRSDEYGDIKIRILDPMLAVNAGGIYLEGKDDWKKEAQRRNIKIPILCHFFHLGRASEKLRLMQDNNQWFVKNNKCVKPHGNPFPAWL